MGTNAIGAMVVAGPEGFVKNQYRTFNIKSLDLTPGDDYAMMREVLTRRFARLIRHGETAEAGRFPDTPDLVVIDGGRGQFEAARGVISALGVEGVGLVAIAKGPDRNAGRETFFVEGRDPFKLSPRDPALFFIQRLRDEAHRFAIGTHRARRKKEFVKSPSTKSRASGRRASGRFCTPSARPRPSPARALPISKKRPASTRRRRSSSTTSSTRAGQGDRLRNLPLSLVSRLIAGEARRKNRDPAQSGPRVSVLIERFLASMDDWP